MTGIYDSHNHSSFSFDGMATTVEMSARAAAGKGLSGICFTEHCDLYVPPMKAAYEKLVPEQFDVTAQQSEIDRVNDILSAEGLKIKVFKGVEIGVQRSCRKEIRDFLSTHHFDEVIASCHYLDETDPFWGNYYKGKVWKEAYGHYLETLYEEMLWLGDDFDIMGHFDYVARYAPYPEASIFYRDFPEIIEAILDYLVDQGKALEINTKSYQTKNGRTPVLDKEILRRYSEKGGEMLSLGSDSHKAEQVAFNFPETCDLLHSLGYTRLVHFEDRQAVFSDM